MSGRGVDRVRALLARPAAARTAWGTIDQALSSISNFALGLLVVRATDVRGFGVYSVLLATYLLSVGSTRALLIEPFTIRREDSGRDAQAAVLGGALAAGLVGLLLMGALAAVLSASYGATLLIFALSFPGLLVQDSYRLLFFARLRARDAMLNDVVWTTVMFALAAVVLLTDRSSVGAFVLCWGGGATVAAIAGYAQCRVPPRPTQAIGYVRRHRDLAMPFFGEFWASYGIGELTVFGMGFVASLNAVGAFKAAALFMGPLNLLNNAVVNIAMPELSRIRRVSLHRVRQLSATVGAVLAGAAIALGAVLLVLPDSLGRYIAGPTWASLIPVVLPLALTRAAGGVVTGALLGTRVLEAAKSTLRTRLFTAPLIYGATLVGARYWDAVGAAAGMGCAMWIAAAIWWVQYFKAEQHFASLSDSGV